jgi:thioredoxin-like negative regulator of GroEL
MCGLIACTDAPPVAPAAASTPSAAAAPSKSAPPKVKRKPAAQVRAKTRPNKHILKPKQVSSKRKVIEWGEGWANWDAGLKAAKAEKKPICLVLYADWCPRCKDLAPVFETGEVAELRKKMVMVKQNIDERPAWLKDYEALGKYVPRVFFFDADGNILDGLTSSNPRFPYFYTPAGRKALAESMRKALGKG